MAIENARLFGAETDARRDAAQELERTGFLLEAAAELNKRTDLGSTLNALADIARRATPHARVSIGLLAADRSQVTFAATAGKEPMPAGTVVPWNGVSSALREALTEGTTRVAEYDLLPEEQRGYAIPVASRLALLVPLVFDDQTVGHIGIDDLEERCEFTEREIEIVESIAALAATAIENARLYEAQQAELARTKVMKELAAAAASCLEPAQLSERVLATARELLEAVTGSVYLADDDGRRAHHAAHFGYPPQVAVHIHERAIDGHALTGRALLSGEIETAFEAAGMSDDPEATEQTAQAVGLSACRMIAVPVRIRGTLVAVMALGFRGQRAFSDDEIGLYRAVAEHLGRRSRQGPPLRRATAHRHDPTGELPAPAARGGGLELAAVSMPPARPTSWAATFTTCWPCPATWSSSWWAMSPARACARRA